MQAFLDDSPLTLEQPTFAGALRAAGEAARRRGRVVAEVLLDGSPVRGPVLESPPEMPLGREVRITSRTAPSPDGAGLAEAVAVVEELAAMQALAVELIQTARLEEALKPLGGAIQGWQRVQQVAGRDLGWASGSPAFSQMLTELAARLRGVHSALQRQDWSALSDSLAYDMREQAENWKRLLQGIQAEPGR